MEKIMDEVFKLTLEEEFLTKRLQNKIRAEIAEHENGILFSRYMELALYDGVDGYYNNLLHKFGENGDFITSPTLSNLFADTLSLQIQELFENSVAKNILEVGGGSGDLLLGLLANLGNLIDKYYVLDVSSNSVNYQKQRVLATSPELFNKIIWLDKLPENFEGIILGNEVLDAQASVAIKFTEDGIYLRHVQFNNDKFEYLDIPLDKSSVSAEIKQSIICATTGVKILDMPYISEVNLNNNGFIKTLANTLKRGVILLIDYGYGMEEYYAMHRRLGSIRGFYRHHLIDNVLQYPGLIDITTSVNWTSIVTTAINNDLELVGYTTQANFLLNSGILNLHLDKQSIISEADFVIQSNRLNKLTSPNFMGDIFKVVGLSKGIDFCEWVGFSNNDRTHTL